MGIGGGIVLIVLGLIFLLNVIQVDIPGLNEYMLGMILVLGGVLTVVLSLTLWRGNRAVGGSGGTTVVERQVERDSEGPLL